MEQGVLVVSPPPLCLSTDSVTNCDQSRRDGDKDGRGAPLLSPVLQAGYYILGGVKAFWHIVLVTGTVCMYIYRTRKSLVLSERQGKAMCYFSEVNHNPTQHLMVILGYLKGS